MTTIHSGSSEALPNSDRGDIRISFPRWTVPSAWPTRQGLLNPYRIATTQGWHSVTFRGRWDTDGITRDFRSFVTYSKRDSTEEKPKWEEAAFVLNSQLIITLSEVRIRLWDIGSLGRFSRKSSERAEPPEVAVSAPGQETGRDRILRRDYFTRRD